MQYIMKGQKTKNDVINENIEFENFFDSVCHGVTSYEVIDPKLEQRIWDFNFLTSELLMRVAKYYDVDNKHIDFIKANEMRCRTVFVLACNLYFSMNADPFDKDKVNHGILLPKAVAKFVRETPVLYRMIERNPYKEHYIFIICCAFQMQLEFDLWSNTCFLGGRTTCTQGLYY